MKKYHQTKVACPLLHDIRLYLDIGDFGEGPHVEYIIDGKYVCPENTYPKVNTFIMHIQRQTTVSGKKPRTLMSLAIYRKKLENSLKRLHRELISECIKWRHSTLYYDESSTKSLKFHTYQDNLSDNTVQAPTSCHYKILLMVCKGFLYHYLN